jgi:hypothetical protein
MDLIPQGRGQGKNNLDNQIGDLRKARDQMKDGPEKERLSQKVDELMARVRKRY